MNLVRKIFPLFCLFLALGCEEENVFEIIETELPQEPTVIEREENLLNYRLAEKPLYNDEGFGVVFSDSAVDIKIYVVASGEVICKGNGTSEFSISGDPDPFHITFFGNEERGYTGQLAQFHTEVRGEQRIVFLYEEGSTDPCTFTSTDIVVNAVSPDFISGSISGTAFAWIPPAQGEDDREFCETLENIGLFTADFSVSLKPCSL